MSVTAEDVREYAGLPDEVPSALLARHIAGAERQIVRDTGRENATEGREEDWREGVIVWSLASALPFLHTFTLSGAAKVGRLIGDEGMPEFRFQRPDEVQAIQDALRGRYQELVAELREGAEDGAELNAGIYMGAVGE